MYQIIHDLPNNPYFVLVLIAVFGIVWFRVPKLIKSDWWKKHVADDFANSGHHPLCFDCNEGNEACYEDPNRCAAMRNYFKLDSREG